MKYLKTYESINRPYHEGDFILIKLTKDDKHILKIKKIVNNVVYANYENDNERNFIIQPYMILYWSENKEELETILVADKYNL